MAMAGREELDGTPSSCWTGWMGWSGALGGHDRLTVDTIGRARMQVHPEMMQAEERLWLRWGCGW